MNLHSDQVKRIPPTQVQEVAKALSGDVRLRILETLGEQTMSVTQLMDALGVAQPTVSINVQILEQAGLIVTAQGTGREKLCSRACSSVLFELPAVPGEGLHELEEIRMPIGLYTNCRINSPCGLASREGLIGTPDDPRSFYLPERAEAQLLWFSGAGFVEYRFPNPTHPDMELDALTISVELCSEAMGFNEDWPSDITLYINDCRIGSVTPKGDYGTVKGKLTPSWFVYGTQYGELFEWRVSHEGSLVGTEKLSGVTLEDLDLRFNRPIDIRFEVEQDAGNCCGLNMFGTGFGNYEQDIKLVFVKLKQ